MTARLGILGKHPGFGDFLRHGLGDAVADRLTAWLDPTLHALRDRHGARWETFWDAAGGLRFWIGRAVAGATLAGVLRPSRDRVGRRYPLLLLAEGAGVAPPVEAPDQALHAALEAHLDTVRPGEGARSLLAGLDLAALGLEAEPPASLAEGPVLWAHHPGGDLAALLAAAAPVDRARAQTARSYWWAPGAPGRAAVWLGQPGLPAPESLGWLLAGMPGTEAGAPAAPEAADPPAPSPRMSERAAAPDEAADVP